MEYEKLILGLKNQNQAVFSYIYDNYSGALYGVIYRMVEDEEKANDILQESFIKIWSNADKYDPEIARLYTWMYRICRNTALNYMNLKSEKLQVVSILDQKEVFNKTIQNFNPDVIDLKVKVEGLDEKHREIIEYLYYMGHSHQEASDILNIPLGTVKSRVRVALSKLKEIYVQDSQGLKPTVLQIANLLSFIVWSI